MTKWAYNIGVGKNYIPGFGGVTKEYGLCSQLAGSQVVPYFSRRNNYHIIVKTVFNWEKNIRMPLEKKLIDVKQKSYAEFEMKFNSLIRGSFEQCYFISG